MVVDGQQKAVYISLANVLQVEMASRISIMFGHEGSVPMWQLPPAARVSTILWVAILSVKPTATQEEALECLFATKRAGLLDDSMAFLVSQFNGLLQQAMEGDKEPEKDPT